VSPETGQSWTVAQDIFEGRPFNAITLTVALIALGVATIGAYYARRAIFPPKRQLILSIQSSASLLSESTPTVSGIEVTHNRVALRNPYVTTLSIRNLGRLDIRSEFFDGDRPLELLLDVPVVKVLNISTESSSILRPIHDVKESSIDFGPDLIKRKSETSFQILTEGRPNLSYQAYLIDTEVKTLEEGARQGGNRVLVISIIPIAASLIAALLSTVVSILQPDGHPDDYSPPIVYPGRASWDGPSLRQDEAPAVLMTEWRKAKNRHTCAPLVPTSLGDGADAQVIRRTTFIGGWGIIYKHPRGDFTIAGTGEPAHGGVDGADPWPFHIRWDDGSIAGYGTEGGQYLDGSDVTAYLAYLIIPGQNCLYNIRSELGKRHLEHLLSHLRWVNVSE
jgi:hypothetical protein